MMSRWTRERRWRSVGSLQRPIRDTRYPFPRLRFQADEAGEDWAGGRVMDAWPGA